MTRNLAVLIGVLAMTGCASSRQERQEDSANAAVTSSSGPQAISTGPGQSTGPVSIPATGAASGQPREQANADLASARARLQEAQRELEVARSESLAAEAEAKSAQTQIDSANRTTDSVAQARAAELASTAEAHRNGARAHLDYANRLVAARQADVDVAQLHLRTMDVGGGNAVSVAGSSGSSASDPRLLAAQDAENAARQRASELGRAALDAQRAWEDSSRGAREAARSMGAATSGTGSGATGTGAATPVQALPTGR